MLYPKIYLNSVVEITEQQLKENNIRGLILDVDNTLIDLDRHMKPEIITWCQQLKTKGIKMCILSNTNKVDKVKKVAETLKLQYIYFAKKPLKGGFKKAKDILQLENEQIAVVGDQIFTDVLGANWSQMFSILVKPINKKDHFITKIKRPIENAIIKSYQKNKRKNKGENKNVHK